MMPMKKQRDPFFKPLIRSWVWEGWEGGSRKQLWGERTSWKKKWLSNEYGKWPGPKDFSLARGALSWGVIRKGSGARFQPEEFANPGPFSQHLICGSCGSYLGAAHSPENYEASENRLADTTSPSISLTFFVVFLSPSSGFTCETIKILAG